LYAPPEAEAVLRIALSPGNSLVLVVASGCMCKKLCVGTVFSLVRRILNAELCWNQNDHQEIHLPVILITCQLPTTPKDQEVAQPNVYYWKMANFVPQTGNGPIIDISDHHFTWRSHVPRPIDIEYI
jgi:hypothetical protein